MDGQGNLESRGLVALTATRVDLHSNRATQSVHLHADHAVADREDLPALQDLPEIQDITDSMESPAFLERTATPEVK